MKSISLFTGAGGMDIGMKNNGCNVIMANDIDKHACLTYKSNHKNDILEGNIDDNMEVLSSFYDIDMIFGGPPCQGFSVAGKMKSDDPRSKLVFSFADAIERIRPRFFLMENVKSLGVLNKFKDVRKKLYERYEKMGYIFISFVANANEFGVPQSRERFFIAGARKDLNLMPQNRKLVEHSYSPPKLKDVLLSVGIVGSETNNRICNAIITLAKNPVLRKSPYAGMMFNGQGRPMNIEKFSNTLPATMGGNRTPIIDNEELYKNKEAWIIKHHKELIRGEIKNKIVPNFLRRLTVDEAISIQTFPKDYIFIGNQSKIYNQIGNAVPPKFAEALCKIFI